MNIKEFRERMKHQRELEVLAWNTYIKFATEIGEGEYQELFLRIAGEEKHHVELMDEILSRL